MNKVDTITAEAFLPDVVKRYPATRAVFDRHGLHGCGGQPGPREQVSWFARLHGVAIDELLRELNEASKETAVGAAEFAPSIADTIYRPFFLAGIATVLTLGCMWGAINLLTIGLKESFSGVNYSWVLAHAHAMVFGFVGFFIMGFAYQAFPRVGDVLARYPQSLEIFVRRGFTPLRNPVLRKTMARVITIEQACRREDVDLTELLNELEHMVVDERSIQRN